MPRMFDILRDTIEDDGEEGGDKDRKKTRAPYVNFPEAMEKEGAESSPCDPLYFPRDMLKHAAKEDGAAEDQSIMSKKLLNAVKHHGVDSEYKAQEIYASAVEAIKTLILKVRAKESLSGHMNKLYELQDNVFNQLILGDSLLGSIYDEEEGEYYLPHHIVNIMILSAVLGLSMGFNKSRLSHLGIVSIFCDLGIDSFEELVKQPKILTSRERETVRAHVSGSLDIMKSAGISNDIAEETIMMHHERASGGGYPRGIGSDGISPYAKILGLVDTYEAMTHTRPHREKMSTHKAVRYLIGPLKDEFDTDVMKVFINKMSVYPIGSTVKLDTGEMAKVISVRIGSPLRPVVMIFRGPGGESITEPSIVDLSQQDFPTIRE